MFQMIFVYPLDVGRETFVFSLNLFYIAFKSSYKGFVHKVIIMRSGHTTVLTRYGSVQDNRNI